MHLYKPIPSLNNLLLIVYRFLSSPAMKPLPIRLHTQYTSWQCIQSTKLNSKKKSIVSWEIVIIIRHHMTLISMLSLQAGLLLPWYTSPPYSHHNFHLRERENSSKHSASFQQYLPSSEKSVPPPAPSLSQAARDRSHCLPASNSGSNQSALLTTQNTGPSPGKLKPNLQSPNSGLNAGSRNQEGIPCLSPTTDHTYPSLSGPVGALERSSHKLNLLPL